jgi:hypothetical protein
MSATTILNVVEFLSKELLSTLESVCDTLKDNFSVATAFDGCEVGFDDGCPVGTVVGGLEGLVEG